MKLLKATGAGNDFLILDLRSPSEAQSQLKADRSQIARMVCDRTAGIGADGFVILEQGKTGDFAWDFYNADGSNAEMCGNAARCVVLATAPAIGQTVKFQTRAGLIEGRRLESGLVEVLMPPVGAHKFSQTEAIVGTQMQFDEVNSGVPHAVVALPNGRRFDEFRAAARALRSHPRFAPAGTNVTFYQWISNHQISVQSFERGVEDFTLACGTGAVAAAFVAFHHQPALKSVDVQMPGGTLSVTNAARPLLTGPARIIAKIEWLG